MDFLNATLWQFRTWHNILCRAKEVAYIRSLSLDLHFLLLKHPSKIVTMLPFCYLRHFKYCTTSVCQGCMRIRNLSFYSYSTVPPLDRRSFPFLSCARESPWSFLLRRCPSETTRENCFHFRTFLLLFLFR